MDPNAALKRIEELLKTHQYLDASLSRMDLLTWIRNGGFEPDWKQYPTASHFVRMAR
jgi:hypothetical protein